MLRKIKSQIPVKNLIQTLLFFLLIPQINFSQWVQTSGPYGGNVKILAALTNEMGGTNLFAGSDAGVFLSTNNGTSWIRVNPPFSNCRATAMRKFHPGKLKC